MLICAFLFPVQILVIDHFIPSVDGVRMSAVQFATATLVNLALALIFERSQDLGAIAEGIFPILYLGICSSGVAYTLQIVGQRGTSPTAASIILSLESVFGALGGAVLLGEKMSIREYIGCGIMLVTTIISQIDFHTTKTHFANN